MEGRNLGCLAVGLLTLACGCTSVTGMLRSRKADDGVAHKAPTFEAYANLGATAGFAPQHAPQQQAEFREEAKLAYLKAIEVDPKYLPAYVGLARLQTRCEDYAGALATYDKALKLAPQDASLWHERGLCSCRQKNWAEAITNMQKAVDLSPGNGPYRTALGYTLGRAGRFPESLAVLTKAEGEAKAHYDIARLLQHVNQTELAKQHVAFAISKDPNLPGARQLLDALEGRGPKAIQTVGYQEVVPNQPAPAVVNRATTTSARPAESNPTQEPATKVAEGSNYRPIRMPPLPVVNYNQQK